jgi:hypothetical protein
MLEVSAVSPRGELGPERLTNSYEIGTFLYSSETDLIS